MTGTKKCVAREKIARPSWWDVMSLSGITIRDEAKEVRPDSRRRPGKTGGVL